MFIDLEIINEFSECPCLLDKGHSNAPIVSVLHIVYKNQEDVGKSHNSFVNHDTYTIIKSYRFCTIIYHHRCI